MITARAVVEVILVLGPTASGKSALAAEVAHALNGEVVSADAFAVYRGMDVGTAKPTAAHLALAPHHLISCLDPHDRCDAARWLSMAEAAIADIHRRGRAVIVAGGTPLYTKVLVEGLTAGAPRAAALRAELDQRYEQLGALAFHAELAAVDPLYAAAHHPHDRRRLVRAMEVQRLTGQPFSSFHISAGQRRGDYRTHSIGLHWDRAELYQRINQRARAMFSAGLVDEVRALRPQLSAEARQAVGYKEVIAYLDGECDLGTAIAKVCQHSRNLAKHQLTWYRRFPDIRWIPGAAPDVIAQALAVVAELRNAVT